MKKRKILKAKLARGKKKREIKTKSKTFKKREPLKRKKKEVKRKGKPSRISKQLQSQKVVLLKIKEQLTGEINHLAENNLSKSQKDASGDLSSHSFHMADLASDNYEREFTLDLVSNEQDLLGDVDLALTKIEDGSYGKCEGCSKEISPQRLKAIPYARLCKDCKEREETR